MPKELYLLGLGVDPRRHATIEVLQAAGCCAAVYVQGLDEARMDFLRRFCRPGALRSIERNADDAQVAARILKEAPSREPAAFATLGHPFYWSGAAGLLLEKCSSRGLPWKTFGSVSPMGVAIAELGVTLGTTIYGLQSFDYAAMARRGVRLNKAWPLVVYFYSPLDPKTYREALEALSLCYPAGHPVYGCGALRGKQSLRVGSLKGLYAELSAESVLYLPALESPRSRVGRTEHHSMKRRKEAAAWVKD